MDVDGRHPGVSGPRGVSARKHQAVLRLEGANVALLWGEALRSAADGWVESLCALKRPRVAYCSFSETSCLLGPSRLRGRRGGGVGPEAPVLVGEVG